MSVQVGDTAITRQFLQGVRDIWFEGLDEERLVPPETTTMRWWMKSEAFDGVCRYGVIPISPRPNVVHGFANETT